MVSRYHFQVLGVTVVIAIVASLLYLPFLDNGLVFDDHVLFSTRTVYDFAQVPFNLHPRTFPYFTLGFVQVQFGSIEAQRIVSLILHILCSLMLFALVSTLLRQASKATASQPYEADQTYKRAMLFALIGAVWFAIHPITVYGAGYLVQRTILFATLFSLLSIWFFCRAFAKSRTADILTAALFYSLAVYSKEHAVMLAWATIPLATLYSESLSLTVKRITLYLVLCAPAACAVVILKEQVIGAGYEPYVNMLLEQIKGIPLMDSSEGRWLVSAIFQAGFYFDYFAYWLLPDVRTISIDMRIDFSQLWTTWWLIPKALLFLTCPIAALYLLRRRGSAALFGTGLLYCWLLFFTELVSVRFQEPFVLYRSYLWAPGYVLMISAVISKLPTRYVAVAAVPILAACAMLAYERLGSLKNEYTTWSDAANKLESKSVGGAGRILFMRGREHLKQKRFDEAATDFTDAISHRPDAAEIYLQRGIAYYGLDQFNKALSDFDQAILLNANYGNAHYSRGLVLERLGCIDAAKQSFLTSHALKVAIATLKLDDIQKNFDSGLRQANGSAANCKS